MDNICETKSVDRGEEKMQYAVELYFDKETENKLLSLANVIAEKGISTKFLEWKTRPHLTLACFNDVKEIECMERLKDFAKNHKRCLHI